MAEGSELDKVLAELNNKIDHQARFTRSLVLGSAMIIIGVIYYSVSELFHTLPDVIVLTYMARLNDIVTQWKLIEHTQSNTAATAATHAAAATAAAATAVKKSK